MAKGRGPLKTSISGQIKNVNILTPSILSIVIDIPNIYGFIIRFEFFNYYK